MNYLSKFGIEYDPFIKNNDKCVIETINKEQLTFRLNHLMQCKGIGLITGEPGLGKTTAIRTWADSLNNSLYKVIYIPNTTISVGEFYREICVSLGLVDVYSKRKNLRSIQREIKRLWIEKRVTPVIIIDEANHLSKELLQDLKIMLNFDMDSIEPYILLLVGQNGIRGKLNASELEAVRQRVSMNYHFKPFDFDDSRIYIDKKLKSAGCTTQLLTDEAYNQIIGAARGIPRTINAIMDKALLLLANKKVDVINEDTAMEAIDEMDI